VVAAAVDTTSLSFPAASDRFTAVGRLHHEERNKLKIICLEGTSRQSH